jgi:hypothetical protein
MNNKIKIVRVLGGLGSQMLAYSLGVELSNRTHSLVKYDFSGVLENPKEANNEVLNKIFGIETQNTSSIESFLIGSNKLTARILRRFLFKFKIVRPYYGYTKKFNFDESVFSKDRAYYYDCWTSYKYFIKSENEVRNYFKFPPILDAINSEILELIHSTNSVSMHIRRGDFETFKPLGGLAPISYYEKAINYISENVDNPVFFVFSNDIEWCKQNLKLNTAKYVDWNKGLNSYIDMQLMSFCKHNIIPNSSFGWWGAFLNANKNKVVISPKIWGNSEYGVEMKDMNLEDWVVIDNVE